MLMKNNTIVPQTIEPMIRRFRDQKVMLDADLATLYGVPTKALNQAVRRNLERFPADFMFQLTAEETLNLKSQTVTSTSPTHGGRRFAPYVFTEHGVAMLSSVLKSPKAVQVNIMIVRAFIRMREMIADNMNLTHRVERLEQTQDRTTSVIDVIVDDINRLTEEVELSRALPLKSRRPMGFPAPKELSASRKRKSASQ
jgi:hypothetical protein